MCATPDALREQHSSQQASAESMSKQASESPTTVAGPTPDRSQSCAHWAFATFMAFQLCAMLSLVSRAPLAVGLGFAAGLFLVQSLILAYLGRSLFLARFVLVAESLVLMLVIALSAR